MVLTNGCFDLLHVGHLRYLQASRALGALRALAHAVFPDLAMPALGTLCYRFGRIAEARWHAFWEWVTVEGIALEPVAGASVSQEPPLVIVYGTGVGSATPFYAQFYRGAPIRGIRSHIKGVVLGYWQGGFVLLAAKVFFEHP